MAGGRDDGRSPAALAAVALAVLLGLECVRVLFPVAYSYRERSGLTTTGLIALAVFLAPVLAVPFARLAPDRRALAGAAAALGVARLALQFASPVPVGLAAVASAVALFAITAMWVIAPLDGSTAEVWVAVVLARVSDQRTSLLDRWDLPPFAVGNLIALGVVAAAEFSVSPVAVYALMGVWALGVGAVVRRRLGAWAAAWAVAGVTLLDVAAGRAGPPWLTGALAATAVLATGLASRAGGPRRYALQTSGALTALGAGVTALWWAEPTPATTIAIGATAAGLVALLLVALVRWARLSFDWLVPWEAVALGTLAAAALASAYAAAPRAHFGVSIGIALVSMGCALAARPLNTGWLRETAGILSPCAVAIALVAAQTSLDTAAIVVATIGFAAVVLAAALAARRPDAAWLRPVLLFALINVAGAVGIGIADLPNRELLVGALALAGASAAVLGLALRRVVLSASAPALLCAAWLAWASDALAGNPQWFTVPIGLTILIVEGFARDALRRRGEEPHRPEIVAVDYVGMGFVAGASIVQIATVSAWYVLLAVALGALISAWGAVTRVLHRTWFGVATVALALLVAIGLPVAQYAPQLEGAELWATIAALGLVALVAAAFLEQGRRSAQAGLARLRDLTSSWER